MFSASPSTINTALAKNNFLLRSGLNALVRSDVERLPIVLYDVLQPIVVGILANQLPESVTGLGFSSSMVSETTSRIPLAFNFAYTDRSVSAAE